MSTLQSTLAHVAAVLERGMHRWSLVGGMAVSAHCEPRFTRDIDVAVLAESDGVAETVVRTFRGAGFEVLALVEQEATGRLATVRLRHTASGDVAPVVDLLFASSGIEPEVIAGAEAIEVLPGLVVPLPRIGHLLALKILSRDDELRPQDIADIRALLAVATEGDIGQAREALSLIEERGFHRGRDLDAALESLLGQ